MHLSVIFMSTSRSVPSEWCVGVDVGVVGSTVSFAVAAVVAAAAAAADDDDDDDDDDEVMAGARTPMSHTITANIGFTK